MILAVTGGTGFVGAHLLRVAVESGFKVRALTRRPQTPMPNVEWIAGDLSDPGPLCEGADAVVHIAGVINARDAAGFEAGNVAGTRVMLDAAKAAGITRFIHVSSLAAREPKLSAYGASKARSEAVVKGSGLDWTIVRPPMVYGPGDRETLVLFKMVRGGIAALPRHGRASAIHVDDLARGLLALVEAPEAVGNLYEPDDGRPLDHADFAALIARALGKQPIVLQLPGALLTLGAAVDTATAKLSGRLPKLSFDRARYLAHKDWVCRASMAGVGGWMPKIDAESGVAETAAWYRRERWL